METLWQDVKYGARMLAKRPGFTAVAVLTLALGIGANTAMFSVADALLYRPLLLKDLDRIVYLYGLEVGHPDEPISISPADFLDYREQARTVEHLSAFTGWNVNLTGEGEPELVRAYRTSGDFFKALGMDAKLGRPLLPDDDQAGAGRVVVLSHSLWQRRFGGDPSVVGRTVKLGDQPYEVVGVMAKDFRFPPDAELWAPLAMEASERGLRGSSYLRGVARLRPGTSVRQANAEIVAISQRIAEQHPTDHANRTGGAGLLRDYVSGVLTSRYTRLLLGAVMFVLLIACSNVANLQFGRTLVRGKELAIRAALGAGRGRLIRQLLTESILLGLGGAVFGLFMVPWALDLIRSGMPPEVEKYLPGWQRIEINSWVLGYTLLMALASGVVAGVLPALVVSRTNVNEGLKESGRGYSAGPARQRLRSLLVFSQIVLAVVLLAGAGLMVKGFRGLMSPAEGLAEGNVLTMTVTLPASRYADDQQRAACAERFLTRLQAIPGADRAALIQNPPYSGSSSTSNFEIEGRPKSDPAQAPVAQMQSVSRGYFRTAQIHILAGREFEEHDGEHAPRVAIVSKSLARRYFPGEDPIGKRLGVGGPFTPKESWTIVGLANDVLHDPIDRAPRPVIYRPIVQAPVRTFGVMVRTSQDPLALVPAVRAELRALDSTLPLYNVKTWAKVISDQLVGLRYVAALMGVMGAMALLLSTVGVYSVMAATVSERTHEVGVRMALGAQRRDVLWLFVRPGMGLTVAGLTVGSVAALAFARTLGSLVFGTSANDFTALGAVLGVLSAAALVACWIPARRATRVEPVVALRYE